MKILLLDGSYRKGNTYAFAKRLLEGFGDITHLRLKDLHIEHCDGCLICKKEGICRHEDDFEKLIALVKRSDIIALMSPVYFNGMTSMTKKVIDRFQQEYMKRFVIGSLPKKSGKKGIFIGTAGAKEKNNCFIGTRHVSDIFFKSIGITDSKLFLFDNMDNTNIMYSDITSKRTGINDYIGGNSMKKLVPVGLSNRHIHLSKEHVEALFGEGYELTVLKDLSQPGQYAANEKVKVIGPKGEMVARILGPARKATQLEISITDSFALGVKPMVRNSGDVEGTPGVKLVGPAGEVELEKGVIVAARHIHMHTTDAENFGLNDKDVVSIRTEGERGVVFNNVLVRVHETYALDCHLDVDEGNAAALRNGDMVEII